MASTIKNDKKTGNDGGSSNAGATNQVSVEEGYTIDIRLFLLTITAAMTIAFCCGVAFGPDGKLLPNGVNDTFEQLEELHVTIDHTPEELQKAATIADSEHQPSGQHLLVDIKGVDSDFLDSEERLAKAMVDAVDAGGLTMLSYHCHKLHPAGVSCVGVLLESHISFHTWPEEGVITLDLFTCGNSPLLPVVPTLKELFGIGKDPVTQWSHEMRGFRHEDEMKTPYYLENESDLNFWILSPLELHKKDQIVSTKSKFQSIEIWDLLEIDDTPSHEDGLKAGLKAGDPRWLTPEVASPTRLLFLDGTLQIISSSDHEYHEALVHPPMFAHKGPKHVAIVGGGEGATLREVLKHNTIESATMIEIDPMLVGLAREHLPAMSDCSDLQGRAANCFDDDLTNLIYADGKKWFMDRFGPSKTQESPEEQFDVVIVDALDPEDRTTMSSELYTHEAFLQSLLESLSSDGVLAIQVGSAPNINDPKADIGVFANREKLFRTLESNSLVKAILVYEEAHCGFNDPHSFMIACKDTSCRERWYFESDAVDFEIYDRILRTHANDRPLFHFDGSTQRSYHTPPKAWETVYCRREPTPFECDYRGLDPTVEVHDFVLGDEEAGSFRLVNSEEGDDEGPTSIFATVDIPKGSYIMPEHLASSFIISDRSMNNLRKNVEIAKDATLIEDLIEFFDENGHPSGSEGIGLNYVEVGMTHLIRAVETAEDANVGRWMPAHPSSERPVYSPVYERYRLSFDVFLVATKDIAKGEELLKWTDIWDE